MRSWQSTGREHQKACVQPTGPSGHDHSAACSDGTAGGVRHARVRHNQGVAWLVLALVFLDELLAVAAAAIWGAHRSGALVAIIAGLAVVVVWFLFASPKARFGGPVVRPATKTVVFLLAAAGLWTAGLRGWAVAFLAFSLVVNALAQLPSVRAAMSPRE